MINKDKQLIENWRPIYLLNVFYKLASACIANRLRCVLPYIIMGEQTGFLAGRYIGENIRLLYDLMFYTENQKEEWRFSRYMPNFLKTRIPLLSPRCHLCSISAIAACYMKYQI